VLVSIDPRPHPVLPLFCPLTVSALTSTRMARARERGGARRTRGRERHRKRRAGEDWYEGQHFLRASKRVVKLPRRGSGHNVGRRTSTFRCGLNKLAARCN
jgi:hypothetical protein